MKKNTKLQIVILLFVSGFIFMTTSAMFKNEAPTNPPVVISPDVPADVSPDADTFPGLPITLFDDYSWRVFIAMVWPAKNNQRGVADASLPLDAPNVPRVFETFKSEWEVFKPDGAAPSAWNAFDAAVPCNTGPIGFNDMVLASFSKFGNLGQADFGELVGPLVAQNNTYVRYLTGFNQIEYQDVLDRKLYLRSNLTNVTLPNGSIDVKSAWMDMTNVQHPERYYTRMAWVFDPVTNACAQKKVGLVGLHIVQKTPSRPQWIWSSFEQVDNIQQPQGTAPFAFHDGTATAMPGNNPILFPPPASPPTIFNVQRLKPIHPSTLTTNAQYQQELKNRGSVWQFYQLVTTQWPVPGNAPANPGIPANTFPGAGATSAFANVTMETFDQKRIQTGCMNCHNSTQNESDFLWSLETHAFPTPTPSLAMQLVAAKTNVNHNLEMKHNVAKAQPITKMAPFIKLKKLLEDAKK